METRGLSEKYSKPNQQLKDKVIPQDKKHVDNDRLSHIGTDFRTATKLNPHTPETLPIKGENYTKESLST
jgi:hypothetical protein